MRLVKSRVRFMEADSSCKEFGCSYSKTDAPGEVYCFKEGPYQTDAEECPSLTTGILHIVPKYGAGTPDKL